jgi:hypothetical protein
MSVLAKEPSFSWLKVIRYHRTKRCAPLCSSSIVHSNSSTPFLNGILIVRSASPYPSRFFDQFYHILNDMLIIASEFILYTNRLIDCYPMTTVSHKRLSIHINWMQKKKHWAFCIVCRLLAFKLWLYESHLGNRSRLLIHVKGCQCSDRTTPG